MSGRIVKIALIALAALALLVVASILVVASFDFDPYKAEIEQLVQEATGRETHIEGDFRVALSLTPAVAVSGVTLANADWGSEPNMVEVGRLEVAIRVIPLLSGSVDVRRVVLHDTRILLETDEKGRANWEFEPSAEPEPEAQEEAQEESAAMVLSLGEVRIEKATVIYRPAGAEPHQLEISSLSIGGGDLKGEFVYNGAPVGLSGRLDFDALLAAESVAFALAVRSGDAELRVAATVTDADGTYQIADLDAKLGESQVVGSLTVDMRGDRPTITGKIESPLIDLTSLEAAGEESPAAGGPGGASSGRILSADPLPFDALGAVDMDLAFAIERLRGAGPEIEDLEGRVTLSRGHLNLTPVAARVGGGDLNGSLSVDARRRPAGIGLFVRGKAIDLGSVVDQVIEEGLVKGASTDLALRLHGRGDSPRALAASLEGNLLIVFGPGTIRSGTLDLLGANLLAVIVDAVNPLSKSQGPTSLECGVVRFDIEGGVARSDRGLAFETRKMNVAGGGSVDLRSEKLDLAIRPSSEEGLDLGVGRLAELVYVGGTLAAPQAKVDLKGVASQAISVWAAVATGGASLLAEEKLRDKEPCKTALGQQPKQAAPPPPSEASAKPNTVNGLIKGLLGR